MVLRANIPPEDLVDDGEKNILLVDDDALSRSILGDILGECNYQVAHAESGRAALDIIKRRKFDLILSDIVMPDMDGLELLRKVRLEDPNQPVIMITAYAELSTAIEAVRLGASDYINKPIDQTEMLWRIGKVLEQARLVQLEINYKKNLERNLTEQGERNRRLFFEAVQTLVNAIEARDFYTKGHSVRVTLYSVGFVKHLGLPFEEASGIQLAAKLHDIGKLGIADEILNKPAKLDETEFEIIRNHPTMGFEILKPIMDDKVLEIILHHHERWNGRGYPGGLKEEQIPYGARILCLADAFDAITSLRAYKHAMSFDEAYEEIRKGAGSQFDPDLVPEFIDMMIEMFPDGQEELDEKALSPLSTAQD